MIASRSSGFSRCKRALVTLHRLAPDRLLERRAAAGRLQRRPDPSNRLPSLAPELVAKPVEHRLPQIRLQRADTARFEVPDPLKRLKQGVLDKIVRVGEIAAPFGSRPLAHRWSGARWRANRRSSASSSPSRALERSARRSTPDRGEDRLACSCTAVDVSRAPEFYLKGEGNTKAGPEAVQIRARCSV